MPALDGVKLEGVDGDGGVAGVPVLGLAFVAADD